MKYILEEASRKSRNYRVAAGWESISPIGINGFPIPRHILELMIAGRWTDRSFPVFPHELFAAEQQVTLYGLNQMASENLYWPLNSETDFRGTTNVDSQPGTIDPAKSVLIADFGQGSDQPIALDYRESIEQPSVVALKRQQSSAWSHC